MEQNQKNSYLIAHILMGVAAILLCYCLFTKNKMPSYETFVISAIANILALVCGIIYIVKGTTKKAASWLKYFEGFEGIAMLASVARVASIGKSTLSVVLTAFAFGLLCILCYAENLGKKRSYTIGIMLVIIEVIKIIKAFTTTLRFSRILVQCTQLLIIVVLVLLLTYKYKDKEARGAK